MIIDKPVGECDRSVTRIDLNQCEKMLANLGRLENLIAYWIRKNRQMVFVDVDEETEREVMKAIYKIKRKISE